MTGQLAISEDRYESLLRMLLEGPVERRMQVFAEACRYGYGGMTIVDRACANEKGWPYKLTLAQFWTHIRREDSAGRILSRGHRKHTAVNVEWGDNTAPGYGPAMAGGQ